MLNPRVFALPTAIPSVVPSRLPSTFPSIQPSRVPTMSPSSAFNQYIGSVSNFFVGQRLFSFNYFNYLQLESSGINVGKICAYSKTILNYTQPYNNAWTYSATNYTRYTCFGCSDPNPSYMVVNSSFLQFYNQGNNKYCQLGLRAPNYGPGFYFNQLRLYLDESKSVVMRGYNSTLRSTYYLWSPYYVASCPTGYTAQGLLCVR